MAGSHVLSSGWCKEPVIIYDQGGVESNEYLQEIFSWPTRRAAEKIRGPLDVEQ